VQKLRPILDSPGRARRSARVITGIPVVCVARELAFSLFHAQQALARLDEAERQAVEAEVKRRLF
jgi:hypothetical protein